MENKNNKIKDLLEKYNMLDKESQLDFRNQIGEGKTEKRNSAEGQESRLYESGQKQSITAKDRKLEPSI